MLQSVRETALLTKGGSAAVLLPLLANVQLLIWRKLPASARIAAPPDFAMLVVNVEADMVP